MEAVTYLDMDQPPSLCRGPSKGSVFRRPSKCIKPGDEATASIHEDFVIAALRTRPREYVPVAERARKFELSFEEVQGIVDGFDAVDDGNGLVTVEDLFTFFQRAEWGARLPRKVILGAWRAIAGKSDSVFWIDILDDFLEWYRANLFGPISLANQSEEDALIYDLAKEMEEMPQTIETLRKRFFEVDTDGSGEIGYEEFAVLMCKLTGTKDASQICANRYQRFWREADMDSSGEINFEEFCHCYLKHFGADGQARGLGRRM
jgi:hypothetical protein